MLNPFETARELYEDEEEFYDVLDFCGEHGVIISNDEVFACGYKTYSNAVLKKSYNKLDKLDTWFIYLLAGNPRPLFDLVEPLDFICFERFDDNHRLIEFERIKRRYGK
tara:strand:- start:169 stop:495 length:327 start_codon:yes stop_codon:yes gene_type:complete